MKIGFKISLIIGSISVLFSKFSFGTKRPLFCETERIDGIFQYGIQFKIKYKQWVWTMDLITGSIREPPEEESTLTGMASHKLLSTLYITSTIYCTSDSIYCKQMLKAKDLLFIRYFVEDKVVELTTVSQHKPSGLISPIAEDQYPWDLKQIGDVWPQMWATDSAFSVKPSVFYPERNEAIFISHSLDSDRSTILYKNISTMDWYKVLKSQPLRSGVRFVGMFVAKFGDYKRVYAVGNSVDRKTSQLYILQIIDNTYSFQHSSTNLWTYFGCNNTTTGMTGMTVMKSTINTNEPIVSSTNDIIKTESSTQTIPEKESKSDETQATVAIIVIVLAVVVVLVIILIIIIIGYLKKSNTSAMNLYTTENNSKTSKTSSDATTRSESRRTLSPES